MTPERRAQILSLARRGRADGEISETLEALVECIDRARIEGFEAACDVLITNHEHWRKDLVEGDAASRQQFDAHLGASRQTIMDWHDAMVGEIRLVRRYQKPKPPTT